MGLLNLFKRKQIDEVELEIRKQPRKKRKHLRELYKQYTEGKVLKIEVK